VLEYKNINDDLEIVVESACSELDVSLEAKINRIWEDEKRHRGDMIFNGKVLSVVAWSESLIKVCPSEYKNYLAQKRCPELSDDLHVCPLAVSGLLIAGDRIVFGKRSNLVTDEAGRWELVPSGGVEASNDSGNGAIDYREQVVRELREELCVERQYVNGVSTMGLVVDNESGVFDIVVRISCTLDGDEIIRKFSGGFSGEYSDLKMVKCDDLERFCEAENLVSVSRFIINKWKLVNNAVPLA